MLTNDLLSLIIADYNLINGLSGRTSGHGRHLLMLCLFLNGVDITIRLLLRFHVVSTVAAGGGA